MKSSVQRRLRTVLSALLTICIASGTTAQPAGAIEFDIPAQPLSAALLAFAEQADVQVFYSEAVAADRRAASVRGIFATEDALRTLLAENQLIFERTDDRTFVLQMAQNDELNRPGNGPESDTADDNSQDLQADPNSDDGAFLGRQIRRDEIIVTATRREESLQDISSSVFVLTDIDLENKGVEEFIDVAREIPGLNITEVNRSSLDIGIRGISTLTGGSGGPTVAYYIDEISVGASSANPQLATFDLNRIEVLRGPQGTLFGEGALGGALRFISNQPDSTEFAGKLSGSVSNTKEGSESYSVRGMVNIPIVKDRLAIRAVGIYQDDGGFIDGIAPGFVGEDINTSELTGARGLIRWTPTDRLTITPSIFYQKSKFANTSNEQLQCTGPFIGATCSTSSFLTQSVGELKAVVDPFDSESEFLQPTLVVNYAFDSLEITSASAYYDSDTVSSSGLFGEAEIFTQEVRANSTDDSPFQWIVGFYYKDEESISGGGFANPFFGQVTFSTFTELQQWAVFGTLSYSLGGLTFDAGARYFSEDVAEQGITTIELLPFLNTMESGDGTNNIVTPRFALSYDVTDDLMIYASAAEGFRRGQININASLASLATGRNIPALTDPDRLWSYEVGLKSAFADGRAYVNAAFYYIDWSDIQISQTVFFAGAGQPVTFLVNAASVESKGLEIESGWRPTDNLNFTLNASFAEAEFTEDEPDLGVVEGDSLKQTPTYNIGGSAEYSWNVFGDARASLRADFTVRDSVISREGEAPALVTSEPYQIVNLQGSIEWENIVATLFVNNVFDERAEFRFDAATNGVISRNRPLTYGLRLTSTF